MLKPWQQMAQQQLFLLSRAGKKPGFETSHFTHSTQLLQAGKPSQITAFLAPFTQARTGYSQLREPGHNSDSPTGWRRQHQAQRETTVGDTVPPPRASPSFLGKMLLDMPRDRKNSHTGDGVTSPASSLWNAPIRPPKSRPEQLRA